MSDQLLQFLFDDMAPRPLTVSELNTRVREEVEKRFSSIWVEGEIVNFSSPSSGHWYFTLHDGGSQIRAACFKSSNWKIRFKPSDGLTVRVRGKISMYEPRGELQLIVESLEPVGEGALRVAFEQVRDKLEREGLFESNVKRPIPQFPRRVGVVTSRTGAAFFDILTVLSRRARPVSLLLVPARVQGENAGLEIVRAIRLANDFNKKAAIDKKIEVLIVGRGGGAAEDLWAFNEEIVARAIRASDIPVISAVGHEVDTTIADLVADMRAPTPSAAAELVAAREEEIEARIANAWARIAQAGRYDLFEKWHRLRDLTSSPALRDFPEQLEMFSGHLDDLRSAMAASSAVLLNNANRCYLKASSRLTPSHLRSVLGETRGRHSFLQNRHQIAMRDAIQSSSKRLDIVMASLDALSPLSVMKRGFSITENESGTILRNADQTSEGEKLTIRLSSGTLRAKLLSKD